MKKPILTLAIVATLIASMGTSCSTSAEKLENAQENATESEKDLDDANKEYLEDVEKYRIEAADKVAINKKSIADFEKRIANLKSEAKEDYTQKIVELNQKNTDIIKKMDDYKADNKDNWNTFKEDFNKSLDVLAIEIVTISKIIK